MADNEFERIISEAEPSTPVEMDVATDTNAGRIAGSLSIDLSGVETEEVMRKSGDGKDYVTTRIQIPSTPENEAALKRIFSRNLDGSPKEPEA